MVYTNWKRLQALIDRKSLEFDGQNLDTPMVIAVAKYICPIALPQRSLAVCLNPRKIRLYTLHTTELNRARSNSG